MSAEATDTPSAAEHRRRADAGLERLRSVLSRGWLQRLWYGVGLPFEGALYIARHPRLWLWAGVPGALIAVGMAFAAFVFFATLAGAITSSDALSGVVAVFVGAVVAVGVVQATLLLFIPAAGPFMEFLVESTEDLEGPFLWEDYAPVEFSFAVFSRNLLITLVHWLLFAGLTWFVGATASCLPFVGWVLAAYLVSLGVAWAATGNDIGTVRLWTFADKMSVIWSQASILSGTSLVYMLVVPVLGPLGLMVLHPSCGVGWTLTLLRLEKLEVPLPPDRRRELLGLGANSAVSRTTSGEGNRSSSAQSRGLSPLLVGGGIAAAAIGAVGMVAILGLAAVVAMAGTNGPPREATAPGNHSRAGALPAKPDAALPSPARVDEQSAIMSRLGLAALSWGQSPSESSLPLETRQVDGCPASYLAVARVDTPLGAPIPGGVSLSFHHGRGLFEMVLRSDTPQEAAAAHLTHQLGLPVPGANVQRWDVEDESVTVTRSRGRTTIRAWHRARQREYRSAVAACE